MFKHYLLYYLSKQLHQSRLSGAKLKNFDVNMSEATKCLDVN